MPSKNTFARWQMGFVLVIVALGLLGALLHMLRPPARPHTEAEITAGDVHVDVQMPGDEDSQAPDYTKRHFDGIKWAFYVFLWLMVLYMYGYTTAAFKHAYNC